MSVSKALDFIKSKTIDLKVLEITPFFTIKEIAKHTHTGYDNTRKAVVKLKDQGILIDHPCNNSMKEKRYRVNREFVGKI